MRARWFFRAVKIAAIVAVAVTVFGFIVKGLWNGLMPSIFGWHAITFWQAVGLLVLSKILFGGGFRGERKHALATPHGRTMGEDVSRGTRKIQPGHARMFRSSRIPTGGAEDLRPHENCIC